MTTDGWLTTREFAEFEKVKTITVHLRIRRSWKPDPVKGLLIATGDNSPSNPTRISPDLLSHAGRKRYMAFRRAQAQIEFDIPEEWEVAPKQITNSRAIELSNKSAAELHFMRMIQTARETKGVAGKLAIAKKLNICLSDLYYHIGKYGQRKRELKNSGEAVTRKEKEVYGGKRGRRKGEGCKYPPEVQVRAIELYSQPYRPSQAQVFESLKAELGDNAPSLRLVQQWCQGEKRENIAELDCHREGVKYYNDHYAQSLRRDWSRIPAGDTFIGDHHEYDVMVIAPDGTIQRPWVTMWMDGNSRAWVGHTVNFKPCALEICLALGNAVFPEAEGPVPWGGLPNRLYVDNGKDYKSTLINGERMSVYKSRPDEPEWGLIQEVGIEMRHTMKYHGQSKSIERLFGTIERGWINLLPGWCANKADRRPEKLKEEVAQTLLWLKTDGEQGEKRLLTWLEFEEEVKIMQFEYNNRPHSALDGATPAQAYGGNRLTTVRTPIRSSWDLIILPRDFRVIRTDGIHFSYKGKDRLYNHPALYPLTTQKIEFRYHPHKLEEIIVIQNRQFLCRATADAPFHPFAEESGEQSRLAQFLEDRASLRAEYREKRKELAQKDPRCYPRPVVVDIKPQHALQSKLTAITGYDKAGKDLKLHDESGATIAAAEQVVLKLWRGRAEQEPSPSA